jgi:oxygen-independent coproporphyrinogen-3 oxidase
MNSIYIHIPFCRQACRYCDFFFSVSLKYLDEFVDKLLVEIGSRSQGSQGSEISSLYFGGGTPSLLSDENLHRILDSVQYHHFIPEDAEVTLECNPDDLNPKKLRNLRDAGVNRISIGIQSFQEKELQLMRRSHHATQAAICVEDAAAAGFKNITVDLIYGIPGQSLREWEENINRTLTLPVTHISAYHLTFEPGTVFDHWRKKGRLVPVEEELSEQMYRILRGLLLTNGFDHYEISNFAKEEMRSRHNLRYWSGAPYIGFGPSAHSFDGANRSWNISSLKGYMEGISKGEVISGSEELTIKERYHDYLITTMRTSTGADPEHILKHFGETIRNHFDRAVEDFTARRIIVESGGRVVIDPEHWLLSDHILRDLFLADDGCMADG